MKETKLMQLRNKSVFAPYFTDFIEQKRALGNRYDTCVETLNLFDDFCISQGVTEPKITPDLFQKWCKRRPNENQTTQVIRINYLQIFSRYMHNNGYEAPCAFHPLPNRSKEFKPYIFTEKEISDFIATVDKKHTVPVRGTPIRHLVYPVLFRVLYGCGLRINEALQLKTEDADLENGTFLIRKAKGGKDRMVVLSDSLLAICCDYRTNPLIQEYGHEYFFPTKDHGFYDASTIYADFRKYLQLSGINHRGRGYGPRLHDFRHTFAVHVIQKWQAEGRDIYLCLPILQSYLGHARLTATEKYLRLVPEVYSQVTVPCEKKFGYIFPEARDETE